MAVKLVPELTYNYAEAKLETEKNGHAVKRKRAQEMHNKGLYCTTETAPKRRV